MKNKGKIEIIILFVAGFIIGIILDRILVNFPILELDPKVEILDAINLCVTIAIAIMIPLFVNKLLENKRTIKIELVQECKELISIFSEAPKIINQAHDTQTFEATNRDQINFIFHHAEIKIHSIKAQMEEAFPKKVDSIYNDMLVLLREYKDYLTGGDLMLSTFTQINDQFYRENSTKYSQLETGLKTIIQKIYKF